MNSYSRSRLPARNDVVQIIEDQGGPVPEIVAALQKVQGGEPMPNILKWQ